MEPCRTPDARFNQLSRLPPSRDRLLFAALQRQRRLSIRMSLLQFADQPDSATVQHEVLLVMRDAMRAIAAFAAAARLSSRSPSAPDEQPPRLLLPSLIVPDNQDVHNLRPPPPLLPQLPPTHLLPHISTFHDPPLKHGDYAAPTSLFAPPPNARVLSPPALPCDPPAPTLVLPRHTDVGSQWSPATAATAATAATWGVPNGQSHAVSNLFHHGEPSGSDKTGKYDEGRLSDELSSNGSSDVSSLGECSDDANNQCSDDTNGRCFVSSAMLGLNGHSSAASAPFAYEEPSGSDEYDENDEYDEYGGCDGLPDGPSDVSLLGEASSRTALAAMFKHWKRSTIKSWRNSMLAAVSQQHRQPHAPCRSAWRRWKQQARARREEARQVAHTRSEGRRARLRRALSHWFARARAASWLVNVVCGMISSGLLPAAKSPAKHGSGKVTREDARALVSRRAHTRLLRSALRLWSASSQRERPSRSPKPRVKMKLHQIRSEIRDLLFRG